MIINQIRMPPFRNGNGPVKAGRKAVSHSRDGLTFSQMSLALPSHAGTLSGHVGGVVASECECKQSGRIEESERRW